MLRLLTALVFSHLALGAPGDPYNEIWTPDRQLREPYLRVLAQTGVHLVYPSAAEWEQLRRPLGDRHSLFPIPLLLPSQELGRIQVASTRRAQTLLQFFQDCVFHQLDHPLVPRETVEAVFADAGISLDQVRTYWMTKNATHLSGFYRPTLMRNPSGELVFLADAFENWEGLPDGQVLREAFCAARGIGCAVEPRDAWLDSYFQTLEVTEPQTQAIAIVETSASVAEHLRLIEILQKRGIRVVSPRGLRSGTRAHFASRQLKVVLNFSPFDTAADRHFLWNDLFARRNIALLQPPGLAALSDPRLLPFVDALTQRAFGVAPEVSTQETVPLTPDIRDGTDRPRWRLRRTGEVLRFGDLPQSVHAGRRVAQAYTPSIVTAYPNDTVSPFEIEYHALLFLHRQHTTPVSPAWATATHPFGGAARVSVFTEACVQRLLATP